MDLRHLHPRSLHLFPGQPGRRTGQSLGHIQLVNLASDAARQHRPIRRPPDRRWRSHRPLLHPAAARDRWPRSTGCAFYRPTIPRWLFLANRGCLHRNRMGLRLEQERPRSRSQVHTSTAWRIGRGVRVLQGMLRRFQRPKVAVSDAATTGTEVTRGVPPNGVTLHLRAPTRTPHLTAGRSSRRS